MCWLIKKRLICSCFHFSHVASWQCLMLLTELKLLKVTYVTASSSASSFFIIFCLSCFMCCCVLLPLFLLSCLHLHVSLVCILSSCWHLFLKMNYTVNLLICIISPHHHFSLHRSPRLWSVMLLGDKTCDLISVNTLKRISGGFSGTRVYFLLH